MQTPNELYNLYVRLHLDYGDSFCHILLKVRDFRSNVTLPSLVEKLESVQYSSAPVIKGQITDFFSYTFLEITKKSHTKITKSRNYHT